MKCYNCGFESEENKNFCPHCGRQMYYDTISLNPMADRVSAIFTSGMFLTICILLSISIVATLSIGEGIPLFPILFTIFLWLCFAQGKRGFVDQTHVRSLSGTLFAYYIVEYVAAGIIALCGLIFSAGSSYIFQFIESSAEFSGSFATNPSLTDINPNLYSLFGFILTFTLICVAVITLLINILGIRKIHKFLQSVYKSIEYNQNQIVYAKAARTWLIVLGSLGVAGAFLSLLSMGTISAASAITASETTVIANSSSVFASVISGACTGLSGIFAGVLINKHFVN